jgi:class 3 adenylate cyclase/predicted negative regulator of RcsB-dependent stress response
MGGNDGVDARLREARSAVADRAWKRAFDLLSALDSESGLEPEDTEDLAKAAYWTGDSDRSIATREKAYAAYIERGDDERAALCALTLRREYISRLQDSVAAGWLTRAERLLDNYPGSTAHGYLGLAHADAARARGDFAQALAHVHRALEAAAASGDRDLHAWGVLRRGMFLVDEGRVDAGRPLIEEVAAAAAGAELGTFTTGAVFSNVTAMCRDLADYRRAGEWASTAMRWGERQGNTGFLGILRLQRAEILRMLGKLSEAESETSRASEELAGFSPVHAASAQHELGEVRLRLGDLAAAEEAFRQALELGEDPQPGLALLRLAQGDVEQASASIRRSLEEAAFDRFARARMLSAQAEIAVAGGDARIAGAACEELAGIADKVASPAIRAASDGARGLFALLKGDHDGAERRLRRARAGWTDVGAPYESAKAAVALADAHLAGGDEQAAAAELESARTTFERIGAQLEARRTAQHAARAGASAGRAVRTFLVTDIVGSTSLIEVIGDEAWDDLRRWHDHTLRSSFAENGGEEIDHAGDGFFIAFRDAASAIGCATEIQRRLVEHRRAHGFAPHVRIGLHATAATRSGDAYSGLGVHAAARIAALAGPGEILSSAETVSELTGVATSDPQTVQLKGIADPVDVVAIDWRPVRR